ncbi:RICIN domain-containing protein [Streptomyces roseicoloratus]|uniref:RICIN domain-containing protein n=1 Tax=Streptomyces roseicoloratus TaxID=2508722 RepID=A0ABY9S490_9ACTN|nr:RICIN domain-containing protein [Streptomyces roseicoloratus]WMX48763.1 RICIN domain-containing protein [Streptomyces roseicoloratus]
MTAPRGRLVGALVAAALAVTGGSALAAPAPAPAGATATYTVTVGAKGSWTHPDDTPASPYIDKDGTFYFQQAHALYGANDPRKWSFFTGTDLDTATRSAALSDAVNPANANDRNNDTTWRCNNSPTGVESTQAPAGSGYAHRNYCDLTGMWVDPDTGDWYGLVHNEFTPQPFGDGVHYDGIDYAVSRDQGRTWTVKDHVITSPYSTKRGDTTAFPQQTYHYGTGDPRLFADTASGYFYVFYGSRIVNKGGGWAAFYGHVARAPIAAKMARGSWQKWYGGGWSQPGVGGRESTMVPVGADSTTGYVPTAKEYDPANGGTVGQQVAAGLTPPTSPLFVMDITWNAHLGLYIGEPQAVDQSGNAPQELYATDDLTTQKWFRLGDTGSYKTASWYRWFLDSRSRTASGIVGKDFRAYCSFGCSGGASSEYVNLSIGTDRPAAPVDTTKSYRIGSAGGRVLAQVAGGTATTSVAAATGSALESWIFTAKGDGSYRIANAATGQLLGVPATGTAGRAWGAKPTVTAAGAGGSTVGQEWFVIRGASAADNAPTGTYKLVNRYSGLVVGLSGDTGRLAETTPVRNWTDATGSSVGDGRTAGEQSLTLTATGDAPSSPDGVRTFTTGGKALDDPDSSAANGTQLVTWTPNGGANQKWTLTRQSDGSYEMRNGASGKCADIEGGSTAAGARVIQWTCHGGPNQRWRIVRLPSGDSTVASVGSGLLLTTASTANGARVTQQPDTGAALQHWTIV